MAKLSVIVPDDLLRRIKKVAGDDVASFMVEAARNELDSRHLQGLVEELGEGLGPVDEEQIARIGAMFARVNAAARTEEGEDS
jgi:hypothetical protein